MPPPAPAQFELRVGPQQVAISHASLGNKGNGTGRENFSPIADVSHEGALRSTRKWLIAPQPNPAAKVRLFCFPYAGGGVVSFRTWPQLLDESVEIVAVEPPGRGTRINETPIDNMDYFVKSMLPELIEWLDRPSAFFGHCLGGVTMFATLCALPARSAELIKHIFACSVRPPHLLKRRGEFEDNLVYDMMLHKEFDVRVPPYAQADEIFVDIVRHFDTPAADRMLGIPKLRKLLLPTIRAEFGMAFNYNYRPVQPFSCPISSFVGDIDPWVSAEDSAEWSEHTRGRFKNHLRKGSHFLMDEDREYILQVIKNEFVNRASH
jgi:surfactin synthase thioesterase subunit